MTAFPALEYCAVVKRNKASWVLVAHACNPSHSGGSQFEASLDKQFMRPYLKDKPSHKRAGGVAQDIGPEFKPQYHKKKKEFVSG
jgi:hypothetical protein